MKEDRRLTLCLNGRWIGTLTARSDGSLEFQYHEGWIEDPNSFPLSYSLPTLRAHHKGRAVYNYLDNLLPDREPFRRAIAARVYAESSDPFDLLAKIGRDCVGAVQFLPPTALPEKPSKPNGRRLTPKDLSRLLMNLQTEPLAMEENPDFRLSIAGVQEKTALLRHRGSWLLPKGSTPTTHIWKPPIGRLYNGIDLSDSVENEDLCSRVLSAYGFAVAKTEILRFGKQKVLSVERFDRFRESGVIWRIPQEDLCQALNLPSSQKYESDGGPGFKEILKLLSGSLNAEKDRRTFVKSQVVFWLMAATDGHAKNYSLRWGPGGFSLTPLYDVLTAQPAIDARQVQIKNAKLALKVGRSRYDRLDKIFRRHWLETAKISGFGKSSMQEVLDEVGDQTTDVLRQIRGLANNRVQAKLASSLVLGMKARLGQLRD